MEISAPHPTSDHDTSGLAHVAFKVASSVETLNLLRDENEIELYIDT